MLSIEIVSFLVKVVPTALFLLIILSYTISNMLMGKRKSLIFLFHGLAIGLILLVLYLLLVNLEEVDVFLLKLLDFFCGGERSFQQLLNLSGNIEYHSLKEVLVDYLPNLFPNEYISLLLADNASYLKALVNLIYRIIFASILLIVYYLLKIILFIVYKVFYSEAKYKRKLNEQYSKGISKTPYKKGKMTGALIGFGKGLFVGVLALSFLGADLYIISGDNGTKPMESYKIDNPDYDYGYQVYQEICQYGNYGIFQLLNIIKDKNDVPCYLLASDFIMRGYYTEVIDGNELTYSVNLREELSTITSFSKQTANLLLKYGGDEIRPILLGKDNLNSMQKVVMKIFSYPEFQKDFKNVINGINSGGFIIEMGLSFIDSFIDNIDQFITNSSDNLLIDLVKILFKKNYYSQNINVEKSLMLIGETNLTLPYVSVKNLFNKDDVNNLVSIIFEVANSLNDGKITPINLIKSILPYLSGLSIFSSSRKNEMNPVFNRLFSYLSDYYISNMLKQYSTLEEKNYTKEELLLKIEQNNIYELDNKDIDWSLEVNVLASSLDEISYFYQQMMRKNEESNNINPINNLFNYFDDKQIVYEKNKQIFNNIKSSLLKTKILGCIMDNPYVVDFMKINLQTVFGNSFAMPNDLVFENYKDSSGNEQNGELFDFLSAIEFLGQKENATFINSILSRNISNLNEVERFIDKLNEYDASGNIYLNYFIDSKIMTSIISCSLCEFSDNSNAFYISNLVKEKNEKGEYINIIKKDELKLLFENFDLIVDFNNIFSNYDGDFSKIDKLLIDPKVNSFLSNSKIAQGTFGFNLNKFLSNNEKIIIPKALSNPDLWISINQNAGELESLLSLYEIPDFSLSYISEPENIYSLFINLDADSINKILDSKIIRYSLSNYLINNENDLQGLTIVIPNSVLTSLKNDVIQYLIKKDELVNFISLVKDIPSEKITEGGELIKYILSNKNKYLSSDIFMTSFIKVVTDYYGEDYFPKDLIIDGSSESLKRTYGTGKNLWDEELNNFLDALTEIFGNNDIKLEDISNKAQDLLKRWNNPSVTNNRANVIEVISNSLIVRSMLTNAICSTNLSKLLGDEILNASKDNYETFSSTEIISLCSMIDILEIDIDSDTPLSKFNVAKVALKFPNFKDQMTNSINRSILVRGIITKALETVNDENIIITPHPLAYDNNRCTFKSDEIITLFNILISLNGQFDINSICNNNTLLNAVYDSDTQKISSYLLGATIGSLLKKQELIALPDSSLDSYGYISNIEIYLFIIALKKIGINNLNFDISIISQKFKNLDENTCDKIILSKIMNSTIVKLIYKGRENKISIDNLHATLSNNNGNVKEKIIDPNSEEIKLLLLNFGKYIDDDFNVSISKDDLKSFCSENENFEKLLEECSIARLIIDDLLSGYSLALSLAGIIKNSSLEIINIENGEASISNISLYSIDKIKQILSII